MTEPLAYTTPHQVRWTCPSCERLPTYIKGVAHWSMAKIDFTYECSDCGAEIRQTVAPS